MRAIVITGAGEKAFAAGADIAELNALPSAGRGADQARFGQALTRKIERLRKPVIVAVNGFALGGGCELAMAGDILIASENAKFGQPEVNLGLIPGYGGSQRMTRLVGKGMAMYLCLTGEMIGAQEALRIGLVQKVVPACGVDGRSQTHRGDDRVEGAASQSPPANAPSTTARISRSTTRSNSKPWSSARSSTPRTSKKAPAPSSKSANPHGKAASALHPASFSLNARKRARHVILSGGARLLRRSARPRVEDAARQRARVVSRRVHAALLLPRSAAWNASSQSARSESLSGLPQRKRAGVVCLRSSARASVFSALVMAREMAGLRPCHFARMRPCGSTTTTVGKPSIPKMPCASPCGSIATSPKTVRAGKCGDRGARLGDVDRNHERAGMRFRPRANERHLDLARRAPRCVEIEKEQTARARR